MIAEMILGLMFGITAIQDIVKRQVHAGLMLGLGAAAVCLRLAAAPSGQTLIRMTAGASAGLLLWLVAAATHEAIGKGDALAVLLSGMVLDLSGVLQVLLMALTGSALAGALLLVCRRADKKSRLPFVPFLAGAYLLYLIMTHGR